MEEASKLIEFQFEQSPDIFMAHGKVEDMMFDGWKVLTPPFPITFIQVRQQIFGAPDKVLEVPEMFAFVMYRWTTPHEQA